MTGMELIIGGRFVGSVIGKVINLGGSYLGDSYDLHTNSKDLLKKLVEIQLPHIQSVIEESDKRQITNKGLAEWLEKLKDVVYEAEDVVDNFEAKRIRESIKGKGKVREIASSSVKMVKNLIFSDNDLKELKSVVNNIDTLCNKDSIKISQIMNCDKRKDHLDSPGSETRSDLATDAPIFGRDKEIEFILDLMFNVLYGDFYHKAKGEGEGSSRFWDLLPRSVKSFSSLSIPWLPKFIQTVKKGDVPEQSQKVKKGDVPEQSQKVKKGDVPEQSQNIKKGDELEQTKSRLTMLARREEPHYNRNQKLAVIPIFGVGGVGKTVVAKKIYNNESVNEHFTLKAWVYVSENCDDKKILRDILYSFGYSFSSYIPMNSEYLGRMLKETIKYQRFLLILDNLRDMTELKWSDLKSLLCFGEVGSVVVVTTQRRSIANTIRTLPVVTLECLDTKSFWELFEYFAFGDLKLGDLKDQPPLSPSKHDDLKKIGKQIADKLHGLPLAGEFIGTLLSKRLEREFWEDICRSDWWNIAGARKNILPSIAVSYNYLDPDLKQCFLFSAIFPKLYVFERKRLVQMWIAHRFIQPSKEETYLLDRGEKRIEDIGEKRLDELIDRSFFEPTIRVGEYLMHDLVRDLAIAVSSSEFCFVKSHDKHLPSLARHLGIDCDNLEVEWKCKDSTRLRTVILFGNWTKCSDESIGNIFAKYNRLRVLDVSYIELTTNEPINVACQLSHLRFVDFSFTGIKSIPDEFCALCHLEVLDVRGCDFEKLPERMNYLICLRHLYASPDTISQISGIGKLTKLQEIEEFRIENSRWPSKKKGHKISELMHMNELSGHLVLTHLEHISSKEEAENSQLDKKIYLKSLELSFDSFHINIPATKVNTEVLDALKPASCLEILKVNGCKWESFPDWVFSPHHGFDNLKDISVKSYWLRSLPAFGELPFLELLCFDNLPSVEKVGREFYGSSDVAFQSLKELTFLDMPKWTHWSNAEARKMIFPRLRKLHLVHCSVLKELPTDSSTSLVIELKLVRCPDLCNIGDVLQGMPSLSHLIIRELLSCRECLSLYCTPLNSLQVMHLEGIKKLCLVEGLKSLVNLRKLVIEGFNEIQESYEVEQENDQISQEEQCLPFLTYLHLRHNYYSTHSLPSVGRLSSLRTLLIEQSPAVEYTTGEESWFIQLTSLEKLEFRFCELRSLPSTIQFLTSLKKLHIYYCPWMLSLSENGLPNNLAELYIDGCPYLIDLCQPTEGDDWHKISHIPFVRLDGNTHLQSFRAHPSYRSQTATPL